MRKIKKNKNFNVWKIIIIFIISTLTISVGYSLLQQNLSVEGTANLITEEKDDKEFSNKNLKLTYEDKTWYNNGQTYYQYDFKLTNIGQEKVENWKIVIDIPSDIKYVGGWSANYKIEGTKLTITGMSYNNTLNAGNEITFGLQISMSENNFKISKVNLNGDVIENNPTPNPDPDPTPNPDPDPDPGVESDIKVVFTKGSSWGVSGEYYTQYDIKLTNDTDSDISDWSFSFELPTGATISNYWNFNYVNKDGIVTVTPSDNNKTLAKNTSITIVMQIKSPTNDYTLSLK